MQQKITSLNFNAANVQPDQAFEPLPPGWYHGQIIDSEVKPTTAGTGSYLQVEIQVLGGNYANRKVFDRFNITNPNPTAVEIGQRQLSALCHAINVIDVKSSTQLHARPFQFKAAVDPARTGSDGKQYDASNSVKGYKAVENGVSAPSIGGGVVGGAAPAWATNPQPQAVQQQTQPQQAQQQFVPQQQAVQPQQQAVQPQAQAQPAGTIPPWDTPQAAQQAAQQAQPQQAQQPAAMPTNTGSNMPPWATA